MYMCGALSWELALVQVSLPVAAVIKEQCTYTSLEYPLSACIAAEWSSTESRGRMVASVFFMQPLGQLCAYGAGLTALRAFDTSSPFTKVEIDKSWRYVVGIGAFLHCLLWDSDCSCLKVVVRYLYEVR